MNKYPDDTCCSIQNLSIGLLTQVKIQERWSAHKNCTKHLLNELLLQNFNYAKWKNINTMKEMLNHRKKLRSEAKFQHSRRDTPTAARVNFLASSSSNEHPQRRLGVGRRNPAPVLPWHTRLSTPHSQHINLEGGCHSSQH